MAELRVKSGWAADAVFPLKGDQIEVGRSPACAIALEADGVSRHHAKLVQGDDGWTVHDLGSKNGIEVNGSAVKSHTLAAGDELKIGEVILVLHSAKPAEEAAAPEEPSGDERAAPTAAAPAAEPKSRPPKPSKRTATIDTHAVEQMRKAHVAIRKELAKVIVGQADVLDQMLTAMLSRGHCLMVGVPGLAKTLMVRTISQILDLEFHRVQFTPDLMPSDITGTDILEVDETTGAKAFRFVKGPIFTNMLLADEINRTPPKTQASLLEAMQERSVTASGHTYELDEPFLRAGHTEPA